MRITAHRALRSLAVALAVVPLVATAAAGAQPPSIDLRSPDAKDAALAARASRIIDLRSPDTRDLSRTAGHAASLPETPARIVNITADGGFDWGDAGIGAGGIVALMLIGLGGAFAVSHHHARGARGRAHPTI
jgi:hypothetical protein